MAQKDLGMLVANTPTGINNRHFISVEEEGPAGSAPGVGLSKVSSDYIQTVDNLDSAVIAALIANPKKMDRRMFLAAAAIAAGCAHYNGGYSKFPIDFSDHLKLSPYSVGGIDHQFDGKIGPKVVSPTWMHVIAVGNFAEHGANYFEAQTPMGHIITMSGFDTMLVNPNDWLTPGTEVGTEGIKTPKRDAAISTDPHSHEDVRLHTFFPKGRQDWKEPRSGLVRKIHNPHDHSVTGSAFDSYDGRLRTYADIISQGKGNLDAIAQRNRNEHIGNVLVESESMGISYLGQVMLVDKALEHGLVKNEGFRRELSDYLARHGAQKAGIFHIYPNTKLGEGMYKKPNGMPMQTYLEKGNAIFKAMELADKNHLWDKALEKSIELEKFSPISDEVLALWGRARAYHSKGQNVKAIAYWLAVSGLAEIKWGVEGNIDGKKLDQIQMRDRFKWQAFESLKRLYARIGMQTESAYFAEKVASLNYQGPK